MAINFPGSLVQAELATGLLVRSVKINGYYLLCDNINFNQTQEIDASSDYIQGGPGSAIADIGAKKFSGSFSFPIRVGKAGILETSFIQILNNAQNPINALTIDTNHLAAHYNITVSESSTENNQLLKIDAAVVKSLTITASPTEGVKGSVEIEGMLDSQTTSNGVIVETGWQGRALSFADCDVHREESNMRTVSNIELTMTNEIETPTFINPYLPSAQTRSDQIGLIGIKSIKWTGKVDEVMRKGLELYSYIHGGWMVNENLTLKIGPMTALFTVPLFNVSELPLSSSLFVRKTSWTGLIAPNRPLTSGGLITY
jgi:hypothetical protein